MTQTCATDVDRQFFERELESFVPERVFDAHCHVWPEGVVDWKIAGMPASLGLAEYRTLIADILPQRKVSALFLPSFSAERREKIADANAWVGKQRAAAADCRGAFFVKPEDDPEWVRQEVRRLKLSGLKCYHTFAAAKPTWEAEIPTYLPEPLIKVADEECWHITLHVVRSRAIADPSNLSWIQRYCQHYSNMKLILAHSARGFQPAHNLEGLHALKGLSNVYFDTSANCEPIAHQAILRILGHERLMYGSDLPISHLRGRSLAAADSFVWLYATSPVWGEKHMKIDPVLVGLEHLRSMKWACWSERLTDKQVEDVFYNNAARLFGV